MGPNYATLTSIARPLLPNPSARKDRAQKFFLLDELVLIGSEPISMQWTNELRKNVGLYPSCKLLHELLSLDLYTRTVVYPFLIKGWSSRRIADRLKVSLITIQKLLEIGREQLKRKLAAPVFQTNLNSEIEDSSSCSSSSFVLENADV